MNGPRSLLMAGKIKQTIAENYRFRPNHTLAEIMDLITFCHDLKLDDDLCHDLICTGNRKGKPIAVAELKQQITTYLTQIQPRGFPFGLISANQFQQFQVDVHYILQRFRIPGHDVRVHGSSLRTSNAKDIDLLAVTSKAEFHVLNSREQKPAARQLNQSLLTLAEKYGLAAVDLLVVEAQTYFPNHPHLNFSTRR